MAKDISPTGQTPQGKRQVDLRQYVRDFWPTPHQNCTTGAGTQGRAGGLNLQTAVNNWPTARASDWKGTDPPDRRPVVDDDLPTRVARRASSHPDPPTATPGPTSSPPDPTSLLRLNPRFVAWLMGLPPDWLDAQSNCGREEMASYRSRLRMHLATLLGVPGCCEEEGF